MNHQDDKQLEAQIDRELKQLQEITAPETLISRVMSRIENPAPAQALAGGETRWLWNWRGVLVASGTAVVLVLCLALLSIASETSAIQTFAGRVQERLSLFAAILNTVPVLAQAVLLALKNLGVGIIAGGLLLVGLAYVTCIGAGMMMVRVAVIRR